MRNTIIYLADDDEDDRLMMREALLKVAPEATFVEATDGVHLMSLLDDEQPESVRSPRPDLILMDMHMPKMTGMEVLRTLRMTPTLKNIPTVIFSTSTHPEQEQQAYREGAVACLRKPSLLVEYERMARSLATIFF